MENKDKAKVCFRADADAVVGYGHFIRALALADMLKDDFDCTFFTQTPNDFQKEEVHKVCKLVELPSDDTNNEVFLRNLTGDETVVLDNYFYTSEYEKTIKAKGCRLVSIGSNNRHYYADIIVNFTNLRPSDFSAEPYARFCLGLNWTILRKPFYVGRNVSKDGFVICIGGTDQYAYSERLYDSIRMDYPDDPIWIIATDRIGHDRIDSLRRKGINLLLNLTAEQMAWQFARARIAIVSASTVAIEALSQGASVVAGHYVDNQLNLYHALQDDGYIWGVGSFSEANVMKRIHDSVTAIGNGEQKKRFEANNTVLQYKELFGTLC